MPKLTIEELMGTLKSADERLKSVESGMKELKDNKDTISESKMLDEVKKLLETNKSPLSRTLSFSAPMKDGKGGEVEGKTEYGKQFSCMTDFLRSCLVKDGRPRFDFQFDKTAHTGMNEDTAAQGGYTVPLEYATEIINMLNDYTLARQLARIVPMKYKTRQIPKQLAQPSVYWVDEKENKTMTKPTLTRILQTAAKMACIVTFTDELLHDNISQVDTWVKELIAEQMSLEEDNQFFMGNGAPFWGWRHSPGINVALMSGASIVYSDIIDLIVSVPTKIAFGKNGSKLKSSVFVTNQVGFGLIFKMVDAAGKPIFDFNTQTLMGYPLYVTNQITVIGGEQPLLFGDPKKGIILSDVGIGKGGAPGMQVLVSQEASKPDTNESAFVQDETWARFVKRLSIDVILADALGYMMIK